MSTGLFAAPSYAAAHGLPETVEALGKHRLISADTEETRVPFLKWLLQNTPPSARMFRTNDMNALEYAVLAGAGIGFLPLWRAARHPDLLQVLEPQRDWEVALWLVTHVDLHRSSKVQTALAHLKAVVATWGP